MTFVRRNSPNHENIERGVYILVQHGCVGRKSSQLVDVVKRRHDDAFGSVGALLDQFFRIVLRVSEIKIAIRGGDVFDLCASLGGNGFVIDADACEEFRRCDVVVFDDLSTRHIREQTESEVPAHRIVIDQNGARIFQKLSDLR